jgi:hypothetical protein
MIYLYDYRVVSVSKICDNGSEFKFDIEGELECNRKKWILSVLWIDSKQKKIAGNISLKSGGLRGSYALNANTENILS